MTPEKQIVADPNYTSSPEVPDPSESFFSRVRRRLGTTAAVWLQQERNPDGSPVEYDLEAIEAELSITRARLREHEAIVLSDPFIVRADTDGTRSLRVSSLAQGGGVKFETVRGMYENEAYRLRGVEREQRAKQLFAQGYSTNKVAGIISAEFKDRRSTAAILGYLSKHIRQFIEVEELQRDHDVRLPLGVNRIPISGPYNSYSSENFSPKFYNLPTPAILDKIQQWQAKAAEALELQDKTPSESSESEIDMGLAVYGAISELRQYPQALSRVLFATYEQMTSLEEIAGELWQIDYHDQVRGLELRESLLDDFALIIQAIELEHEAARTAREIESS